MKKVKGNVNIVAFFNILGPIVLNGISFFTMPIFTRLLGTDNYGMYTIYYTWVNTFTILVSLQVMGTVGVANVRLEEDEKKKYYSSVLTLILITFGISMTIVMVGMPLLEKYLGLPQIMIILMMVHSLGMAFVNFATIRYTYEKKAHITFAISVSIALLGIILSLLLLQLNYSKETVYYGRAIGSAIPYIVIGGAFAAIFLFQGRTFYSVKYWKFCLPLCLPMVFHGLSQLILAQADKVMLKNMMNNSVVGIYSFTFTFAHVMNIIYNAFDNTWVPFYYDDVKAENYEAIHRRSKNYIYVFTALSIGFILLAPDVIKLFAGKDFWTGISLIPVFVLANYMMFLYSFPVNYEFYHKKSIHIAIGTSAAAVINCILNYILIPKMGMAGAAVATLISYVMLWIFHHLVSKYFIGEHYHYTIKEFLPGLCVMIIASLVVFLFEESILIRWILAILVGLALMKHLWKTKSIF